MKKRTKDSIIIGMALFAMFFGAGNLIFPPQIGVQAGQVWMIAALGFFFTGIGLPLLGIVASVKGGEALKNFQPKIGKTVIILFSVAVALTLGLVAIPRTGATTYEMGFGLFFEDFSPILSSVIFFSLTVALAYKPTGIVDRIGKFLTPVLVLMLGTIIIKGIMDPIGVPNSGLESSAFARGFLGGYQTMDALGAIIFGGIVLNAFREKGYTEPKEQMKMTFMASGIAGLGLALVYGGLMYLGSTTVGTVSGEVSKTSLTIIISSLLLGRAGTWLLGIGVSFACLTTSVGLVATIADFFSDISHKKIPYKVTVIVLCTASAFISVLGVDGIVTVAGPILVVLYPIAILLIIFILLGDRIQKPVVYRMTLATTLAVSVLQGISATGLWVEHINPALESMPLGVQGFPWLMPAMIAMIASYLMSHLSPRTYLKIFKLRRS